MVSRDWLPGATVCAGPGRLRAHPKGVASQGPAAHRGCLPACQLPLRWEHTLPMCCPAHGGQEGRGGTDGASLEQSQPRQAAAGAPLIRSTGSWEHLPLPPPALTEMASLVHVSMMGCSRLSNSFMSNWVSSKSFCICCSTAWATAAVTCSWEAEQEGDCVREETSA